MVATSSNSKTLKINAHDGQRETIESFGRREALVTAAVAGTGGGKTVSGYVALVTAMALRPGQIWVVAEPTRPMIERILLTPAPGRYTLPQFLAFFDPDMVYLKSKGMIHHKWGTVVLASAENPDSLQGAQCGGIWLDECGLMSRLAYLTAIQRVGFYGGNLLLTTTPYNLGWLKADVWDRWVDGDASLTCVNYSSLANPKYPREMVEEARTRMSAERFSMMYEGKFGRPEGMIYNCFDDAVHVVDDFPIPDSWERSGGFDFGFNHPAAGLALARDDDGVWYAFHEYYEREKTARYAGEQLRGAGLAGMTWFADPARPDSIVDLRKEGLGAVAANNEVLDGIDTVYGLFKTGRLKIFRSLRWLRDELGSYCWEQDRATGEWLDKPVKEHDDLADALRYVLHSVESRSRLALHS